MTTCYSKNRQERTPSWGALRSAPASASPSGGRVDQLAPEGPERRRQFARRLPNVTSASEGG